MTRELRTEERIVDNLGDEDEVPFTYSITSYGADFPVDGLVKRLKDKSVFVPPFQRRFVWTIKQSSRFVESLLLGLPVPGIFLAKEPDTQKLLVIDGQQRLQSLLFFYEGLFSDTGREFKLTGIQSHFRNTTYKSLAEADRRRLDDSILHATVVKQDEPKDDDSSIYLVFERLNTGGEPLTAQEIRACLYHGAFNSLLNKLNQNKSWRSVYGKLSTRMRDQELILRFLAMFYFGNEYKKPMKHFLNKYMRKNKELALHPDAEITTLFESSIQLLHKTMEAGVFKRGGSLNAAIFDSVMVGVACRLQRGAIKDTGMLRERYQSLLSDATFKNATESGTSSEESVSRRLELATKAFADVK